MNLEDLCTNCLTGTLKNGTCTYCRKNVRNAEKRPSVCLPERYMLGKRYYLGKVIGNGGFGITYLAWDCKENRRVIVKELFPRQDIQRNPTNGMVTPVKGQEEYFQKLKQRFKEEARILYNFRNEPLVVDVYELMEENNTIYYSMEYLPGFDLRTYMGEKGPLSWPQFSEYMKKLLAVLHILHGRGMIHRDISPDNIFLISKTDAKLIDFGSVRCFNSEQGLTTILKQAYAPIEQYFTNGNQGPWTDIYSLSVTIYHALSGQQPPKAPERIKRDGAILIGRCCPELPGHVAGAITKGMAVRSGDRFQNVESMAEAMFPGENLFAVPAYYLRATSGCYQGKTFEIFPNTTIMLGRDRQCDITYPVNCQGVSRKHCCLKCDASGNIFIRDERSTYGTVVSGHSIKPDIWYQIGRGNTIILGSESYCLN